ncbi:MAG TPA: response regulator transcription factor [Thiotrichales bacterium]|nr:response regulator transcription factor [Thiotrichales bacterium]
MRLLLVEDDRHLARRLQQQLSQAGFVVDHADNGIDAQFLGEEQDYGIVVLDLGLPGRGGMEVLKNWRAAGNTVPVLILTARDGWQERVDGLRAGADDYLGKPFQPEELLARIEAVVRRHAGQAVNTLEAGGLVLDRDRRDVRLPDGNRVPLTATEFRILEALMLAPGRVLSKARLGEQAFEDDEYDSNRLEVYIRRLRKKIGPERILTRRGQGYLFAGDRT